MALSFFFNYHEEIHVKIHAQPSAPPVVSVAAAATHQGVARCHAAWAKICRCEPIDFESKNALNNVVMENELANALSQGKAVLCILFGFPGKLSSGNYHPIFEYVTPTELLAGFDIFFQNWRNAKNFQDDTTVDVIIYRVDLGPSAINPATAFRTQWPPSPPPMPPVRVIAPGKGRKRLL